MVSPDPYSSAPPLPPVIGPSPAHTTGVNPSFVQCITCGYDLSGTAIGGHCPECGAEVAISLRSNTPAVRTSSYAVAALVCGILSFVMCGLIGVISIALYFPAMKEVRAGTVGGPSKAFAIAGLITGIVALALTLIGIAFFVVMASL